MNTVAASTVDAADIERFTAIAAEWWDPMGKFRPLHKFNPVRLEWLRDSICARYGRDPLVPRPLAGLRLLDVGCGGGLLAEPLARMGAQVVGIDAGARNVAVAAAHAAETGTEIDYRHTTIEALAQGQEKFDVVLAMEVVEHVADLPLFLGEACRLLTGQGMLFLASINRTPKSFAFAIVGAEYVLRWLPRGTHDWRKFPRPSELVALLRGQGLTVGQLTGVTYNPFSDQFRLAPRDLDVNYMLWAAVDPELTGLAPAQKSGPAPG